MEIRRTFWVILIILGGSFLGIYLTTPDQSLVFFRLVYFCIFLLAVSWIWTAYSTKGLSISRRARGLRQEVGQVFEEHFEITNTGRILRPWIEVIDDSQLSVASGSRVLSWLSAKERRYYSAYTLLTKRGQYILGPTYLCSGDPFGLFRSTHKIPAENFLLVLPYMFGINKFPLPPGILTGGRAQRQKTFEVTPHAAGVREYAAGDPLNRIHWPSSARHNRLISKEFDQDSLADVWIFLDASMSSHYSVAKLQVETKIDRFWFTKIALLSSIKASFRLPADTFEYEVSIAASIARFIIQTDLALGFVSSAKQLMILSPEKGERQLNKILEMLALVKPMGQLPLVGVVNSQSAHLSRGSVIILITSSASDQIIRAADSLLHRDTHPVVVLVTSNSFGSNEDNSALLAEIKKRRIPVVTIVNGDELPYKLETGFSP
jgi:uncharacterized protein (DUF58 family)